MLMPFTMLLFGLANGEPGTGVRSPLAPIEYTYIPLPKGGAATRYLPDGVIAIGPKGLSESKVVRNVNAPVLVSRSKMRILITELRRLLSLRSDERNAPEREGIFRPPRSSECARNARPRRVAFRGVRSY